MKTTKRLLAVLLTMVLLCVGVPLAVAKDAENVASGYCGATYNDTDGTNLTWSLDSEGTLTIDGEGAMDSYYGYSSDITNAPWGQYYNSIYTVAIGENVGSVDAYAFWGCTSIVAFRVDNKNNSLYSDADGCLYLNDHSILLQYPAGHPRPSYTVSDMVKTIGSNAFYNCASLQSVVIPEGVTRISGNAFQNCRNLSSVVLPDSLTSINNNAFENCDSLIEIEIPDNVNTISSSAFGKKFHQVILLCSQNSPAAAWAESEGHPYLINGSTDAENIIEETVSETLSYIINKRTHIMQVLCQGEMPVDLPSWISYQGYITTIELSNGCVSVSDNAFLDFHNLKSISLPDSIETIGVYAFSNTGLQRISIPDSVTIISDYAFRKCPMLRMAEIGNGVKIIPKSCFNNCSSLECIQLGDQITTIANYAFGNCVSLSAVLFGSKVQTIEPYAFSNCSALQTVVFPSSLRFVKDSAFSESGLKDAYFYSSSNSISEYAFPVGVTIHGFDDSDAARFAEAYGYPFVSLNHTAAHEHSEYLVKGYAASCTNEGLSDGYRCSICGVWVEEQQILTALGHDYVLVKTQAPTEHDPGWQLFACSRCDSQYSETLAPATHTHQLNETERINATCTKDGYVTSQCSICDFSYTDLLAATGHLFGAWSTFLPTVEGENWVDIRFCTVCGDYEVRKSEQTGTGGTTPIDPTHTHGFVLVESREPSCTVSGYERYICACGAQTVDFIDPSGHDPQIGKVVEPTCTEAGYTPFICTRCGETVAKTDPTDPLDHDYKPVYVWEDNDKTATASLICSRCGDVTLTETVEVETEITVKPTCSTEGELTMTAAFTNKAFFAQTKTKMLPIDPDAHVFRVTVTPPTCVDDGYTTHACRLCRYGYSDEIVDALGHDWNDGVVTLVPTCTTTGTMLLSCKREGCGKTMEKKLPENPDMHVLEATVHAPTCSEDGYTAHLCRNCKYGYTDEVVPALGHTDAGNDGYCDYCGEMMQGGDHCKYCGQIHGGAFGWLVRFFHKIFALFKR